MNELNFEEEVVLPIIILVGNVDYSM